MRSASVGRDRGRFVRFLSLACIAGSHIVRNCRKCALGRAEQDCRRLDMAVLLTGRQRIGEERRMGRQSWVARTGLLVALALQALLSVTAPGFAAAVNEQYRLGPGDTLSVTILRHPFI